LQLFLKISMNHLFLILGRLCSGGSSKHRSFGKVVIRWWINVKNPAISHRSIHRFITNVYTNYHIHWLVFYQNMDFQYISLKKIIFCYSFVCTLFELPPFFENQGRLFCSDYNSNRSNTPHFCAWTFPCLNAFTNL